MKSRPIGRPKVACFMPLLQETKDEIAVLDLIQRIERLEEIVDAVVENMMNMMKQPTVTSTTGLIISADHDPS